ncbi:unnamed protein product [Allacma fusca]|uniref:Cytochrome P450 n=1 Tax=Allacma fusca TaxID=39272 RepID=A0A8J2KPM9_9HEXA|nr:unnamed protein product [Allacma fusca]
MGPVVIVLALVTLVWLGQKAWERWDHFQIFRRLGIPGPPPSVLFGNLVELRKSGKSPLTVYDEWQEKFGHTYGYYAGTRPTLVIRNLETVKDVLVKHSSEHFSNRMTPIVKSKPLMDTLMGLRDRRWKELRSILAQTFSTSKMRHISKIMNRSISVTTEILTNNVNLDVDVLGLFQGLSCEVICECALAMRVDCQRNQNDTFLVAVREFLRTALNPFIFFAICFPWFAGAVQFIVDKFAVSALMTNIVCQNVETAIQLRRSQAHDPKILPSSEHKVMDVLQTLLDAAESPHIDKITDDEIVANSWIFLLGGFETTSAALTFTSYLLALNPEVQQTLFEELQAAFSEDEDINFDSVNNLQFLDQVVCESLRIYPPVVTFIVRETSSETRVESLSVPKGVSIHIPVWQIHHDPELWPDPFTFKPSRFSSSEKKTHHSMAWIPFGAGPRNCVGMRFGLLQIKLAIARIIRSFRLVPSPGTLTKLKLNVPTVTIVPEKKIYLKFEKR